MLKCQFLEILKYFLYIKIKNVYSNIIEYILIYLKIFIYIFDACNSINKYNIEDYA